MNTTEALTFEQILNLPTGTLVIEIRDFGYAKTTYRGKLRSKHPGSKFTPGFFLINNEISKRGVQSSTTLYADYADSLDPTKFRNHTIPSISSFIYIDLEPASPRGYSYEREG